MAEYVDGVKIAELPEASSVSDTNILVTEDSDATKQVTADKLKDYTNAELLQRVTSLEEQITQLNTSLTDIDVLGNYGTSIPENSDLNDYWSVGRYYTASSTVSASLSNCPVSDAAFGLFCGCISATSRMFQLIIKNNTATTNLVYIRINNSGSYGSWYMFSTSAISTTSLNAEDA